MRTAISFLILIGISVAGKANPNEGEKNIEIRCESKEIKGTQFSFYITLNKKEQRGHYKVQMKKGDAYTFLSEMVEEMDFARVVDRRDRDKTFRASWADDDLGFLLLNGEPGATKLSGIFEFPYGFSDDVGLTTREVCEASSTCSQDPDVVDEGYTFSVDCEIKRFGLEPF